MIRWTFDVRCSAFYFYLSDRGASAPATQRELGPGLVVDFDASGHPVGVELLVSDKLRSALPELEQLIGEDAMSSILFAVSNAPMPVVGSRMRYRRLKVELTPAPAAV